MPWTGGQRRTLRRAKQSACTCCPLLKLLLIKKIYHLNTLHLHPAKPNKDSKTNKERVAADTLWSVHTLHETLICWESKMQTHSLFLPRGERRPSSERTLNKNVIVTSVIAQRCEILCTVLGRWASKLYTPPKLTNEIEITPRSWVNAP